MESEYEGPERRKGYEQLDAALENVERLHGAVTTLATAVVNTVPRQELEALKDEMNREFRIKILTSVVVGFMCITIVLFFINRMLDNQSRAIDKGHKALVCLESKADAEKTGSLADTARITCERLAE